MKNQITLKDIQEMEQGLDGLYKTDRNQYEELCNKINDAAREIIEVVWELDEHGTGLGWMEGKLVIFHIEKDRQLHYREVSITESIGWMEKMKFAESELGLCATSEDDAKINWLAAVREALTAKAA